MAENEQVKSVNEGFINSKFGKVAMTLLSVLLIFAGPTYVVYVLASVLKFNGFASFIIGGVLLVVGLFMMRYLVKRKIIS